jgi:hypothetical protein
MPQKTFYYTKQQQKLKPFEAFIQRWETLRELERSCTACYPQTVRTQVLISQLHKSVSCIEGPLLGELVTFIFWKFEKHSFF